MSYFELAIPHIWTSIPYFVAWIVALTLAVIMFKRRGSRAERFLVIGCAIKLGTALLNPFLAAIPVWLRVSREASNVNIAATWTKISIALACLSLAGIVCLVYAFWTKWKAG